ALLQTLELALVALVLLGQVAQIPNPAQELDDGSLERQDVRHGGALRLSLTRRRVEGKTKAAKWLNQWNFPDFWCDRRFAPDFLQHGWREGYRAAGAGCGPASGPLGASG